MLFRSDADDVINGVPSYSIKPQMFVDLRNVFDHMDSVEYPTDFFVNIDYAESVGQWPQLAVYNSALPETIGVRQSGGVDVVPPWRQNTEAGMIAYLAGVENAFIATRIDPSMPYAGDDLVLPQWAAGTYPLGYRCWRTSGSGQV